MLCLMRRKCAGFFCTTILQAGQSLFFEQFGFFVPPFGLAYREDRDEVSSV